MTTDAQARQNLIDGMSEFIPDELESTEEEIILILTNALGQNIIALKKEAGLRFVQQKMASLNGNTEHAEKLVEAMNKTKKELSRLNKDYKLLGGGQTSEGEGT